MLSGGVFRRQQEKEQVHRLAVNRVKGNTRPAAPERNDQILEIGNFSVGNRHAVTDARRSQLFPLLQHVDGPGPVDSEAAGDQNVDQFRQHIRFCVCREIFTEEFAFKHLIQSHAPHLILKS